MSTSYVDNVGIIGADRKTVALAGLEAKAALEGAGLECHGLEEPSRHLNTLGVEFNSELRCYRPTRDRYWNVLLSARWLLKRRSVSGKQLEILLGHSTYLSMLRRSALSCFAACYFAACYKYVRAFYDGFGRLWDSVRREIRTFVGLMPLIVSDWDMPWHLTAVAYDSCPEGRGSVSSHWLPSDMAAVGGVSERSRFGRRFGGKAARASALRRLDPLCDVATVLTRRPDFELLEADWEVTLHFPEVPTHPMTQERLVRRSRPWRWPEKVHIGEARSSRPCASCLVTAPLAAGRCGSGTTWESSYLWNGNGRRAFSCCRSFVVVAPSSSVGTSQ